MQAYYTWWRPVRPWRAGWSAHLRVTTAITIHPVDAKGWRFKQAARMALAAAFESAGVEL